MISFSNSYEEQFYQSLRIRLVEEKIIELYPSDKIQSPVHLSIGQEAVATGICQGLRKTDLIFGTYRSHAFYMAKGGDLPEMFAELYGKRTGVSQGKAGSMHLAAPKVGFMGSSAVVASSIPHAVGAAMAAKVQKKDQVIIAVFGDGATEEGVYHESLNFAALHKLPVLFICENNALAVHSHLHARESYNILNHAKTYGIKTYHCEAGYSFEEVNKTFAPFYDELRNGHGPIFCEVKTFRYMEHVGTGFDFQAGYRSKEDYETWRTKDPLILDQALVRKFQPHIDEEIAAAVRFAEESPWPGPADLLTDVH